MLRFQFHPFEDEDFGFRHFSIEGDAKVGYVLLGWNDAKPRVESDSVASETGDSSLVDECFFEENDAQLMLQLWFETLGDAMRMARDSLGIPKHRWQAPITRTPSGRVVPPIPKSPPTAAERAEALEETDDSTVDSRRAPGPPPIRQ